jgi:hypothetical protein
MSNTTIDFRTLPSNVPSLCIPRVFLNINETRIRSIFTSLDMGEIEKVDIVTKKTEKGENFNRVFIHFRHWNNGSNANAARERLLNGKEIKIIYDDPWFWKISAYREKERKTFRPSGVFKPVIRTPPPPRIQFDDEIKENKKMDKSSSSNRERKENNNYKKEQQHHVPEVLPEATTLDLQEQKEINIDYGNMPLPKKLNFKPKKVRTIKEEEKV